MGGEGVDGHVSGSMLWKTTVFAVLYTFEARIPADGALDAVLAENASNWSRGLRAAWTLLYRRMLPELEAYAALKRLGFTSYQVGSLLLSAQTRHASLLETKRSELRQIELSLAQREAALASKRKKIATLERRRDKLRIKRNAWSPQHGKERFKRQLDVLGKLRDIESEIRLCRTWVQQKEAVLRDKRGIAKRLSSAIERGHVSLCFGSKKLLAQRPTETNRESTPFSTVTDWRAHWNAARDGQWWSVGHAKKPQGNPEVQWLPDTNGLRLRLTDMLAHRRMDERDVPRSGTEQKFMPMRMQCRFVTVSGVDFVSHRGAARAALVDAIGKHQPVTMRVLSRLQEDGSRAWYVQASVEVPADSVEGRPVTREAGVIGVDLNARGVAWCAVTPNGNRMPNQHGFMPWNLKGLSEGGRKQVVGTTVAQVVRCAERLRVTVAIESLDFRVRKAAMRANIANRRYNEMLSSMPTSQFEQLMSRACDRHRLTMYSVNPSYSSVGGFAKFGRAARMNADTSAAWWLARQALYGSAWKSEGVQTHVRKFDERLVFPQMPNRMQSMKVADGLQWKDVARGLGKNRKLWGARLKNLLTQVEAASRSEEQPALATTPTG